MTDGNRHPGPPTQEWQRRGLLVRFRMTAAEREEIERQAERDGVTTDKYAQLVLRNHLARKQAR